ncbi:hypothetical protein LLH06_13480 [Mucilaginibacter daejeonensis]|uniref:tetratricopeptide repeat protein n=1 Tax=Mucilaginibacter daejeonensis TaxID=398049 RepID=UPI001D174A6B|nr:tetratricopeptide repeat protein [Mucilaginibacter daejeonensis]UEG51974.1 hypothetical protein LLH06_13480 [Mucilaginibacter daejeonensis]
MKLTLLSMLAGLMTIIGPRSVHGQTVDQAKLLEYYQAQKYVDAAAYLKSVYTEPVTDPVALRNLAYTAQMAGKLTDAETYYTRLYNIDSTRSSVLNSLAGINLRRGNLVKAGDYFGRILAADTANFYVLTQLANISLRQRDTVHLISYLEQANRVNAEDADVASDLSDRYVEKRRFKDAEGVLSKAIAVDSQNVILLQSLIKLTHKQRKWPETVKVGNQLLKLGDGGYQTAIKLGQAYFNLKNYECCLEVLANLDMMQQTEASYYYMGMSFKRLKRYPQAIENLEKAISEGISPAIASYYGEIGNSYNETKRNLRALTAYQKGLQFGDSPMIFYSLATLYDTDLKKKALAVRYFKKYLATRPASDQQALVDYTKSRITALTER